jgi:hypothetical protein
MNPDDTTATKKPDPKLPSIFPPKLEELRGMTGKKADKKMLKQVAKPPLMPKALQKKNASAELLSRIKG